jgi:lipase chaperone LimK
VDGELRVDAAGRLQPGPETLRLFDYFLSARGEESDLAIRMRVAAEVQRRLPEGARAEALAIYDRYVAYLARGAAIDEQVPDPADIERRYQLVRELRREVFGPSLAYALFAEQERIEGVAVERRRVMDDPTLSDREKIERLAEIQARLPEDIRRAEAEAYAPLRLTREEDELRARGGSDAEVQALREQLVGEEAAGRLAELDRERERWSERMAAYRLERDRVMDGTLNAPEEARIAFLRRVRERHFTPEELPRVEALDRIELRERSLGRAPVVID